MSPNGFLPSVVTSFWVLILWPAHVLFGQRVTRREVLGALISVAGVALFFV